MSDIWWSYWCALLLQKHQWCRCTHRNKTSWLEPPSMWVVRRKRFPRHSLCGTGTERSFLSQASCTVLSYPHQNSWTLEWDLDHISDFRWKTRSNLPKPRKRDTKENSWLRSPIPEAWNNNNKNNNTATFCFCYRQGDVWHQRFADHSRND